MCNHPEVMRFHRFGRFSGHYDKEDPPAWCPELKNEKEKKDMEDKEKRIHKQLVNIPIGHLAPHPNNPRKDVGDVEELAKSIEVNGLMQNLTVVPKDADKPVTPTSDFIVLIGNRRLAAAKQTGYTGKASICGDCKSLIFSILCTFVSLLLRCIGTNIFQSGKIIFSWGVEQAQK